MFIPVINIRESIFNKIKAMNRIGSIPGKMGHAILKSLGASGKTTRKYKKVLGLGVLGAGPAGYLLGRIPKRHIIDVKIRGVDTHDIAAIPTNSVGAIKNIEKLRKKQRKNKVFKII